MAIEATSVTHAPGTKVWEQKRRDLWHDTLRTARDIGRVRLNHSRLNVFSSLAEGDQVDHFKFQVASRGKLRIGVFRDSETRFEILNNRGRVIADSTVTSTMTTRFRFCGSHVFECKDSCLAPTCPAPSLNREFSWLPIHCSTSSAFRIPIVP